MPNPKTKEPEKETPKPEEASDRDGRGPRPKSEIRQMARHLIEAHDIEAFDLISLAFGELHKLHGSIHNIELDHWRD